MSFAPRLAAATPHDLPRVLALARRAIAATPPGTCTPAQLALWHAHPASALGTLVAWGRHRLALAGDVLLGAAGSPADRQPGREYHRLVSSM
jgi:hypothetical protein